MRKLTCHAALPLALVITVSANTQDFGWREAEERFRDSVLVILQWLSEVDRKFENMASQEGRRQLREKLQALKKKMYELEKSKERFASQIFLANPDESQVSEALHRLVRATEEVQSEMDDISLSQWLSGVEGAPIAEKTRQLLGGKMQYLRDLASHVIGTDGSSLAAETKAQMKRDAEQAIQALRETLQAIDKLIFRTTG